MADKYQSVNGAWPENVPELTAQEAASAGRRLYRLAMGKPFRGKIKIVTGNRHCWIQRGTMNINLNRRGAHFTGWSDLVHGLSHWCHYRLHPGHKPHDGRGTHAFLERTMIEHVVNSGWLDGKLKRPEKKTAAVDVRQLRAARVTARIKSWEAKRKRAENALRKLRKQERYYAVALAA